MADPRRAMLAVACPRAQARRGRVIYTRGICCSIGRTSLPPASVGANAERPASDWRRMLGHSTMVKSDHLPSSPLCAVKSDASGLSAKLASRVEFAIAFRIICSILHRCSRIWSSGGAGATHEQLGAGEKIVSRVGAQPQTASACSCAAARDGTLAPRRGCANTQPGTQGQAGQRWRLRFL